MKDLQQPITLASPSAHRGRTRTFVSPTQHNGGAILPFLLIGLFATGLQFLLLTVFIEIFALHKVFASALSYALSAIANYLLNYHCTFNSQQQHRSTLPKFRATAMFGLLINTLSFGIMLRLFEHYLIAQIIATGITFVINYLLHRYWIYRSDA